MKQPIHASILDELNTYQDFGAPTAANVESHDLVHDLRREATSPSQPQLSIDYPVLITDRPPYHQYNTASVTQHGGRKRTLRALDLVGFLRSSTLCQPVLPRALSRVTHRRLDILLTVTNRW